MLNSPQSTLPAAGPLLTRSEAAQYLQVHPRTVRQLVLAGDLPEVKFGRSVRFRPSDLVALVDRKVVTQ